MKKKAPSILIFGLFMVFCAIVTISMAFYSSKYHTLPDGELPKTLEQCVDVFIDRNDQIYLLKLEVKQLKEELDANSRK